MRKSQKTFGDYFSRAEHAYTDWLARNRTTLLSHRSTANRGALAVNHRLPIEPYGEPADLSKELSTIFDDAGVNVPSSFGKTERTQRVASTQLMGGVENDVRPGGAAPPRPRQEPRPEPPREVHPPLRETPRDPECEQLRVGITSLRVSRDSYIYERNDLLAEANVIHKEMVRLSGQLQERRASLAMLEYQLRILDQLWPPSTPRGPNPGRPGPIPDIFEFGFRNDLRRRIADVRRQIRHLENHMNFKGHEAMRLSQRVQQANAKRIEGDHLLFEKERKYWLRCGRSSPPGG